MLCSPGWPISHLDGRISPRCPLQSQSGHQHIDRYSRNPYPTLPNKFRAHAPQMLFRCCASQRIIPVLSFQQSCLSQSLHALTPLFRVRSVSVPVSFSPILLIFRLFCFLVFQIRRTFGVAPHCPRRTIPLTWRLHPRSPPSCNFHRGKSYVSLCNAAGHRSGAASL